MLQMVFGGTSGADDDDDSDGGADADEELVEEVVTVDCHQPEILCFAGNFKIQWILLL